MKLVLVRHGNTFEKGQVARFVGARTDLPLTETGKKQAENAADYIKKEGLVPSVIYHSSLKRQLETASIISKRLGLSNLIESSDLKEIDYGSWENLSPEEIKFMWPQEFKDWEEKGVWPENVFQMKESDVRQSLQQWLSNAFRDFAGHTVLAVSSNGILKLLNQIILRDKFLFKNAKVRTGGICLVEISENKSEILKWDYLP